MKLLSLTCQHCGAPLEVPAKITQLTCQFCGTRLQVQRTGSATYTEALGEVAQQMARVADNTDQLKLEQEIARLDRDWMMNRERFMMHGKDGQLNIPSRAGALIGGVVVVVFGVIWTIFASGIGMLAGFSISHVRVGPFSLIAGLFPCFGVLFVIGGIIMSVIAYQKAVDFERHQQMYQSERSQLLGELRGSGGSEEDMAAG